MNLTFTSPVYLWFLIAVPLLILVHFFSLKYVKRKALKFANFEAIERVTKRPILGRNITLMILRIFIIILFVLAASGVVIWYMGWSSDFDFVLAIDSSSSMMIDDYSPNRMEAAKDAAVLFVDSLGSKAKIGVMGFGGVPYLTNGLSDSYVDVKNAIMGVEIGTAGGTAIGTAIYEGVNVLKSSDRAKVIVLLTDGQNNVGIGLNKAIKYANDNGVIVHTIGVATQEGGSFANVDLLSRLDRAGLENIADKTGGKFFLAGNEEDLLNAYRSLASSQEKKVSFRASLLFMLIALGLLFLEWILQNTKYRTIP